MALATERDLPSIHVDADRAAEAVVPLDRRQAAAAAATDLQEIAIRDRAVRRGSVCGDRRVHEMAVQEDLVLPGAIVGTESRKRMRAIERCVAVIHEDEPRLAFHARAPLIVGTERAICLLRDAQRPPQIIE